MFNPPILLSIDISKFSLGNLYEHTSISKILNTIRVEQLHD